MSTCDANDAIVNSRIIEENLLCCTICTTNWACTNIWVLENITTDSYLDQYKLKWVHIRIHASSSYA
jgi:hypothetical protein